jgi:hypothetical protein
MDWTCSSYGAVKRYKHGLARKLDTQTGKSLDDNIKMDMRL